MTAQSEYDKAAEQLVSAARACVIAELLSTNNPDAAEDAFRQAADLVGQELGAAALTYASAWEKLREAKNDQSLGNQAEAR